MKNISAKFWIIGLLAVLVSCTEKYPMYDLEGTRLGFKFEYDENAQMVLDSAIRYSFVYEPELTEMTIWVELQTSGFLSDKDRPFEIEQVTANSRNIFTDLPLGTVVNNAVSGVHFKPFDDPEIKSQMVVKAGSATAKFPVVFYRHEDMKTDRLYLRLKVKENSNFEESFPKDRYAVIEVTDMLSRPPGWEDDKPGYLVWHYFGGPYSTVKHRFMIETATWLMDDQWFRDNFGSAENVDAGFAGWLSSYFTQELIKENDARLARGESVITDENGNPIYFVKNEVPMPYKSN